MWLINTSTLKLKHFDLNFNQGIPYYTVLSHTWGKEELTLQEWNKITKYPNAKDVARLKRKEGYMKIKDFCRVSKAYKVCPHWLNCCHYGACQLPEGSPKDGRGCCRPRGTYGSEASRARAGECKCGGLSGITWAWADTVCIDKTSSTELQEHIVSMFRIYERASICFAFLVDIDASGPNNKLEDSSWFTRGWTLQELIAPEDVAFFDAAWQLLGHRRTLSTLITKCTRIDTKILSYGLRFPMDGSERALYIGKPFKRDTGGITHFSTSAAQIFSWMARRRTSRAEDIVYSLLGLFDVQMPLLYGEGYTKAFYRLQEEILRRSNDYSVLAWSGGNRTLKEIGIFAPHPIYFSACGNIQLDAPPNDLSTDLESNSLSQVHSVPVQLGTRVATLRIPTIRHDGKYIAVLNCFRTGDRRDLLGISIEERQHGNHVRASDQLVERMHISARDFDHNWMKRQLKRMEVQTLTFRTY